MESISLILGKKVRSTRTVSGMSQEKLAELSGLHSTYIGQIERGEKCPTIDSIYKIARGLDISLSDLFKDIESKTNKEANNYADLIYDKIYALPLEKQKKMHDLINEILNL